MPRWVVHLVKLLFEDGGHFLHILLLFEGVGGVVDSMLLHLWCQKLTLTHIGVLDDGVFDEVGHSYFDFIFN